MRDIWKQNPDVRNADVIEKAQRIIDRIVFVCFCEDRWLLPQNELQIRVDTAKKLGFAPWEMLKKFFLSIDKWDSSIGIPDGYNGGLFRSDTSIDTLIISDSIIEKFVALGRYDFSEDGGQLSVEILGHIFEQSISDIEEIRTKIESSGTVDEEWASTTIVSKRKKDGIFYTPAYIVEYIVENSLGKYLREHEEKLIEEYKLKEDITEKNYRKREIEAYTEYQKVVQNVKVLDPACGSGAFLVRVFDYLLAEHRRVASILYAEGDQIRIWDTEDYFREILKNNIYGVDLNEESVEITKLSLWLKSAVKGKKLVTLDANIQCGNSLIDDPLVAGDKAFDWNTRFADIMASGGFDVIVGNPPYIKEFVNKNAFEWLKNSPYYQGKMDLWQFFSCKWFEWLKDDGIMSYIAPNNWVTNAWASIMRSIVLEKGKILDFVDFGDYKVFENVGIQTMIFVIKKTTENIKYYTDYAKFEDKNISGMEVWIFLTSKVPQNGLVSFQSEIDKNALIWKNLTFQNNANTLLTQKIENNRNFILEEKEVAQWIVGAPYEAYLIENIDQFSAIEKGFIYKYYTNSGKYAPGTDGKYVIYLTKDNFVWKNITDYKNIFNHFEPLKSELIQARIRLKTPNKPYYFLHREREENFFKKWPKIIAGTRVMTPSFYYTEDEYYCSRALNIIKTKRINLKYLSTILNSSIAYFWLKYNGKMTGNLLQVDKWPLLSIPIKNIPISEQQPFIERADAMLALNRELHEKSEGFLANIRTKYPIEKVTRKLEKWWELNFAGFVKELKINIKLEESEELIAYFDKRKSEVSALVARIDATDREIDDMVFELYGLTAEEKKVVLESNGK